MATRPASSSAERARPPSRSTRVASPSPLLYAQPSSVHFGGFSLDAPPATQRVLVHNNSAKPVRVQYTLPSLGVFRASFPRGREPFLSPGLSQELVITCAPTAYQYYYDCIQIKCEQVAYASNADAALAGTLLVPLHAYPVVNTIAFPTRLDFGAVALGTTVRKAIDLACSVPIEFEFELAVLKPHAAFTIFPLRGVIPPNGATRIEIEFKPLLYATASADVELRVSQLGFQPLPCTLTGSSTSDVASKDTAASPAKAQAKLNATRPRTAETKPMASPVRLRSPLTKHQAKDAPSDMVDGVEIPRDLSSHASVSFVLTQQPGKLKPKDLKKAIDAHRAMRQEQQDAQAALSNAQASDAPSVLSFHVLLREEAAAVDRARVGRQLREMVVLQELSEIETIEKELEFQSHKIRLGQELLTDEQIKILQEFRRLNQLELERREREEKRGDVTSKAYHMLSQPTPATPYPPRGTLPAGFAPAVQPDFKTYKNDLWGRRKRVVQRFVRAISSVIVRNRAAARLRQLRRWLGDAPTRASVRDRVEREWQLLTQGGVGTATHATVSPTSSDPHLYLESFPLVEETDRRDRALIHNDDWSLESDPLTFFPLRERDEALVAGHEEPLELPPLATYVPLESTRAMRTGALDECSRIERDETAPAVLPMQDLRMPSTLEMLPRDVFLRPSAAVRPLVRIRRTRETLSTFALRPQRVFRTTPQHWGLALDTGVGTRSLRSLRTGLLRLSDRYAPRTERRRGVSPLLLCGKDEETKTEATTTDELLYPSVWDASDGFVPPLSVSADDVPCLSDSESDDEDEAATKRTTRALPTWHDAVRLWDETEENEDDGVAYEPGELLGQAQGITSFARYRHLIQSERAYNAYRDDQHAQLPTLVSAVASKILHPDCALVVEGHGPSRPLHEITSITTRRESKTE